MGPQPFLNLESMVAAIRKRLKAHDLIGKDVSTSCPSEHMPQPQNSNKEEAGGRVATKAFSKRLLKETIALVQTTTEKTVLQL